MCEYYALLRTFTVQCFFFFFCLFICVFVFLACKQYTCAGSIELFVLHVLVVVSRIRISTKRLFIRDAKLHTCI